MPRSGRGAQGELAWAKFSSPPAVGHSETTPQVAARKRGKRGGKRHKPPSAAQAVDMQDVEQGDGSLGTVAGYVTSRAVTGALDPALATGMEVVATALSPSRTPKGDGSLTGGSQQCDFNRLRHQRFNFFGREARTFSDDDDARTVEVREDINWHLCREVGTVHQHHHTDYKNQHAVTKCESNNGVQHL